MNGTRFCIIPSGSLCQNLPPPPSLPLQECAVLIIEKMRGLDCLKKRNEIGFQPADLAKREMESYFVKKTNEVRWAFMGRGLCLYSSASEWSVEEN